MRITKIGIPPGGSTNQVLVKSSGTDYDVEWGTGSGSATPPGGVNTQVQFNDGGSFGGDAGFTYNKTTNRLTLGSLVLNDVIDPGVDTDKFLVLTSLGVVSYRNGASVLVDIGGVPTSRSLTINGTSYDLSANRTWSVGTVTSVGLTAGTGISVSGSPVIGSGSMTVTNTAPDQTVALTAGSNITITGTYPNFTIASTGGGSITGSGSSGQVTYWNGTSSITGEANLFWDAANDRLGIGTNSPSRSLDIIGTGNNGVVKLQNTTNSGWSSFEIWNSSGSLQGGFGWGNASAAVLASVMYFDVLGNNPFIIRTNSNERIRFFGNGNVGINTGSTDAGFKLDINGTARVQDNLTISDAKNVILGTTTGTKIGTATTQKIGFFNATPVVQPSAVTTSQGIADALSSLGLLASSTLSVDVDEFETAFCMSSFNYTQRI